MIELGSMTLRDDDSINEARQKILGLVRALGGTEVVATRAATAVSEMARRLRMAGEMAGIEVMLAKAEQGMSLRLRLSTIGARVDVAPLTLLFSNVSWSETGSVRVITADLALPVLQERIDAEFVSRERARILRKSRAELLDELQVKNQQLERYNESLEITVAERTAELQRANTRMQQDLDAGAAYVRALIPPPMEQPLSIRWKYVPSSDLGGDTIGYHWIDDDHLAIYLIDVTGHGLDSALLAVTITNFIRSQSFRGVDMKRPDEVVAGLNESFQAQHHGKKYFTIWYGVYQRSARSLAWTGGGHHPSVLLIPGQAEPRLLESGGPIMGCASGMEFPAERCTVPVLSRLLVFSDGIFEILREERLVWNLQGAIDFMTSQSSQESSIIDSLVAHARELRGAAQFDDDVSIIEILFP